MMQEQEEGKILLGNPALSQLIHRHDASFLTLVNDATSAQPEAEYDIKNTESALMAYEQAIELAPREATLHYHKGQVLEQLGRQAEAQNAYEVARILVRHTRISSVKDRHTH